MKLYVSFGHKWNLWKSLMVFEDMTEKQVRKYMQDHYNNDYAFIYEEDEALPQIPEYGLELVKPGVYLVARF